MESFKNKAHWYLKGLKVHLFSNRPASIGDSVRDNAVKIASLGDFLREVWSNIKNHQPVPTKWSNVLDDFKNILTTKGNEWDEFIESIEAPLLPMPIF